MLSERLHRYFEETERHILLIDDAREVLRPLYPLKEYENLQTLEKFALNTLIFRFSKLQDLIGSKIFRNYLEFSGYDTAQKSFFDLLKELEKEGITDIDTWDTLRKLRNQIAHEYPEDTQETLESINLFIEKSTVLIQITEKLKEHFYEIERQRNR